MGLLKKLSKSSFGVLIDENLRSCVIRDITNMNNYHEYYYYHQNYAKLVNLEV